MRAGTVVKDYPEWLSVFLEAIDASIGHPLTKVIPVLLVVDYVGVRFIFLVLYYFKRCFVLCRDHLLLLIVYDLTFFAPPRQISVFCMLALRR